MFLGDLYVKLIYVNSSLFTCINAQKSMLSCNPFTKGSLQPGPRLFLIPGEPITPRSIVLLVNFINWIISCLLLILFSKRCGCRDWSYTWPEITNHRFTTSYSMQQNQIMWCYTSNSKGTQPQKYFMCSHIRTKSFYLSCRWHN